MMTAQTTVLGLTHRKPSIFLLPSHGPGPREPLAASQDPKMRVKTAHESWESQSVSHGVFGHLQDFPE